MSRTSKKTRRFAALAILGALLIACAAGIVAQDKEMGRQGDRERARSLSPCLQVSASSTVPVIGPEIRECQALGPAAPHSIWGVDSASGCGGEVGWDARGSIPWQQFAQGEYVGHARAPHVAEYRLREGDQLAVFYRRTRREISRPYELQVGDRILVESLTAGGAAPVAAARGEAPATPDSGISRELVVQPDGTVTLPLLGQVRATRRTVQSLRDELEELYKEFYRIPSITVTPVKVNTRLEDLMETVDSRSSLRGGLQLQLVVTPAGMVQLPGINGVFVQGLTLAEMKQEIDARYDASVPGVEVTIDLVERAKRFVYIAGEVNSPGRFELVGPTTAMQAITMAGSAVQGANLRQVVVFRRGDDWRLMATMLDLRGAFYGRRPVPADDIWLSDSDIVLVTKTPIKQADELIDQLFTKGLYSVVPIEVIWNLSTTGASSL